MVRKLDLRESAMVSYRSPVVAIMNFEYAECSRPIPVHADRRLRVDEPTPTAWSLITFARRTGFFASSSVAGECASMTISAGD
jgi:hypothetical protein